jgi:hypothetical protein
MQNGKKKHGDVAARVIRIWVTSLENYVGNQLGQQRHVDRKDNKTYLITPWHA